MPASEIRNLFHETPFEAFTSHPANGRKFVVDHPEIAAFSAVKNTLPIALRSGGFAPVDLRLTTHTEPEPKSSRRRES